MCFVHLLHHASIAWLQQVLVDFAMKIALSKCCATVESDLDTYKIRFRKVPDMLQAIASALGICRATIILK